MKKSSIWKQDMGEAISMQDVIALMTVVFVLFFIIMVPLVNVDKIRTERAKTDIYWNKLAQWLLTNTNESLNTTEYISAFGLEQKHINLTELSGGKMRYIEAVGEDSTLHIIAHNTGKKKFNSMFVQPKSGVMIYGLGTIKWSVEDKEWFTENTVIDYGQEKESMDLEQTYRTWVKSNRGEFK